MSDELIVETEIMFPEDDYGFILSVICENLQCILLLNDIDLPHITKIWNQSMPKEDFGKVDKIAALQLLRILEDYMKKGIELQKIEQEIAKNPILESEWERFQFFMKLSKV